MYIYYCWLTVVLPSYQDFIVAGMARKGYMIGPISKDGVVSAPTSDNAPSFLLALSVYQPAETTVSKIYDDLVAILTEMKAFYYSVIVSLSSVAIWSGTNIQLPAEVSPPSPKAPSDKNLN